MVCFRESVFPIKIISVYNSKWLLNGVLSAKYCMCSSPGLGSVCGDLPVSHKCFQILENITCFNLALKPGFKNIFEISSEFFTDNEYYFFETCPYSIIN